MITGCSGGAYGMRPRRDTVSPL